MKSVHNGQRRVVITGLGVVAPNGTGKEEFWNACVSGRSGVRHITQFDASSLPTRIAGEVANFDPQMLGVTPEETLNTDRGTQFALAAANLALQDAALAMPLTEDERDRFGVYLGSAMAGGTEGEKLWIQLFNREAHPPGAAPLENIPIMAFLNSFVPANAIAAHHQLHGPSTVFSTGCAAGADAIGQAFWASQEERADRMLAGGTDSAIT